MAKKKAVSKTAAKRKTSKRAGKAIARASLGPALDIVAYARAPLLDVARLHALGRQMAAKVPPKPDNVAQTGREFVAALDTMAKLWIRAPKRTTRDARPFDNALDNAWAGLLGRLEAWTRIEHPNAAVAEERIAELFPGRLDFTRLDFAAQWAESEKRLDQIGQGDRERSIRALAGAEFISAIRVAHRRYGEAIGVTSDIPEADEGQTNVREAFLAARRALGDYTTQIAAAHNASRDAQERRALRRLLAPVDAARAAANRTAVDEPDAPVEPVEDDERA